MAFWGVEIKPGKPFTLLPDKTCGRLRISQATLGVGSSNNKSSSVQCNVGKRTPVLLCSLLPDKVESLHLELEFQETEQVTFSVIGPRSVHLTGYVLGKTRQLLVGDDESESYGEDIGDADTEVSDEGFSDDDEYEGSFIDDDEPKFSSPSLSLSDDSEKANMGKKKAGKRKCIRKRLRKTYELSESEDGDFTSLNNCSRYQVQIIDSDEDDQKLLSSLCGKVKMDSKASKSSCIKVDDVAGQATDDHQSGEGIVTRKKLHNVAGQATDDHQADDSKVTTKKLDTVAGPATDESIVAGQATSDHQSGDGIVARKKLHNVAGQATDDYQADDSKVMTKKLDIVAGQATDNCQSVDRKVKRKKLDDVAGHGTDDCRSDDKKGKRRKKLDDDVAGQPIDDCQSGDKKVERKKRKNKKVETLVETEKLSSVGKNEANPSLENGGTTEVCSTTIFGGLVIEELEIGEQDGKVATSGRKVKIHYTGRLKEQGQVFYSTVGKSPFKFRLGKDAALDGLHLGIDGMRVGGKRRLIIPPELGYGSKGRDGVPPNAWLVMDVELLRVH